MSPHNSITINSLELGITQRSLVDQLNRWFVRIKTHTVPYHTMNICDEAKNNRLDGLLDLRHPSMNRAAIWSSSEHFQPDLQRVTSNKVLVRPADIQTSTLCVELTQVHPIQHHLYTPKVSHLLCLSNVLVVSNLTIPINYSNILATNLLMIVPGIQHR